MKKTISLMLLVSISLANPAWSDNGAGGSGDPKPVPHYIKHLVNSGEYAKAGKKLKYFVRQEKSSFKAWHLLAVSQFKTEQFKASLKSHKKAVKLNSTHVGVNRSLGELYLAMGDKAKAKNQLVKLQRLCGECGDYVALNNMISAEMNS